MSEGRMLYIVAGPNGAGKSTFGQAFVGSDVTIFNGDAVFAELCKKYPTIEPERLKGGVAVALEKARDEALAEKKGLAFETNFSSDLVIDLVGLFKKAGYSVNLIYFGLDNHEVSISRVHSRVALGGHDIPTETIRFNYDEGIGRIKNSIALFDKVEFVNTNPKPIVIATYVKDALNYSLFDQEATWFNQHFKPLLDKLIHDQNLLQRKKQQTQEKAQDKDDVEKRSIRKGRRF